jgi:bifunctional non-homologous end joining protein LigD
MPPTFHPMPLTRRPRPFNDPEWLFELKYDGFRALARVERSKCQLISRDGHPFASFSNLAESMADSLPATNAIVLDGEIVCLDRRGRPQFNATMRTWFARTAAQLSKTAPGESSDH